MMRVETATSAALRRIPVANAFASPGYIATSGIFTPARCARSATVITSHFSASPSLPSIVLHFIETFTIVFDSMSDISAPAMPKMNAKMKSGISPSPPISSPTLVPQKRQTSSAMKVSVSTATRFVNRNVSILFMEYIIEYFV